MEQCPARVVRQDTPGTLPGDLTDTPEPRQILISSETLLVSIGKRWVLKVPMT